MSAIKQIALTLYGQEVQGLTVPIGSTVEWIMDCQDPETRDYIDLTLPTSAVQMTVSAVGLSGLPRTVVFSREATISGSPVYRCVAPWSPSDTIPSGVPLTPGSYAIDVWRSVTNDADETERMQLLSTSIIQLTPVATLPDTPVTPLPSTPPLGLGLPGVNWRGPWQSGTYSFRDAVTYPDPNGGDDDALSTFFVISLNDTALPPLDNDGAQNFGWSYLAERGEKGAVGGTAAPSDAIPSAATEIGDPGNSTDYSRSNHAHPSEFPDQSGSGGKVLGTDGATTSWVDQTGGLPSQTGSGGKVLGTDGTDASWVIQAGGGLTYSSVVAMRAAEAPTSLPSHACLSGHYSTGDGGGGDWFWVADSTRDDDNGLTTLRPDSVPSSDQGRWWRFIPVARQVNPEWCGAIADSASHTLVDVTPEWTLSDWQAVFPHATSLTNEIGWCAIEACSIYLAVPRPGPSAPNARGGTIQLPGGVICFNRPVSARYGTRFGISFRGAGYIGGGSAATGGGSAILYNGGGDFVRAVDARSTGMFSMHGVSTYYTPGFTGILIDCDHDESGNDATKPVFVDCTFAGTGVTEGTGARALVGLSMAIDGSFYRCVFASAQCAVQFKDNQAISSPYSNGHSLDTCSFQYLRWGIKNAHDGTTIRCPTVEGLGGVMESFYHDDCPYTEAGEAFDLVFGTHTITRSTGSWPDDGWENGMDLSCAGTLLAGNDDVEGTVTDVTDTVITIDATFPTTGTKTFTDWPDVPCVVFVREKASAWTKQVRQCEFALSGNTIVRSTGSWPEDNFRDGMNVNIYTELNTGSRNIVDIDATTITVDGAALTDETTTNGVVNTYVGGGPITFIGGWYGDQFRMEPWLRFRQHMSAVTLVGANFVGGERVASFGAGGGGLTVVGGRFSCPLTPFLATTAAFSGVTVMSLCADVPLFDGAFSGNIVVMGSPGSNGIDRAQFNGTEFKVKKSVLEVTPDLLFSPGVGFQTMGLQVSQGGVACGMGSDGTSAHIQSAGGGLKISYTGATTSIAGGAELGARIGLGIEPTISGGSQVQFAGDAEAKTAGGGYILQSPDATRYRIKVADDGTLSTEEVT